MMLPSKMSVISVTSPKVAPCEENVSGLYTEYNYKNCSSNTDAEYDCIRCRDYA
uniref:Uncharacterized protein n=1 Tax=Triticum urartu TaxID=4572 RepID=A0A8R7PIR0_TRIUA